MTGGGFGKGRDWRALHARVLARASGGEHMVGAWRLKMILLQGVSDNERGIQ